MAENSTERPLCLVVLGWITLLLLYGTQAALLVSFLAIHEHPLYGCYSIMFLLAPIFTVIFLVLNWPYADEDEIIRGVWMIWGAYIVAYVATVATIFATVAKDLTKEDDLGINELIGTLCITPGLLILLLQLTICPSYRKPLLSLSLFAALDIFDGIEMLEIFLLQNEGHFTLDKNIEICIVVFACFGFFLSPFGLIRNEFVGEGKVEERDIMSMIFGVINMIGTNLPFLVLRAIIWHQYEAAVFIAKNAVALVIGVVEFGILAKSWWNA